MGYDYKEPHKADDTKFLCLKVKAGSDGAVSKNIVYKLKFFNFAENCFRNGIEKRQG